MEVEERLEEARIRLQAREATIRELTAYTTALERELQSLRKRDRVRCREGLPDHNSSDQKTSTTTTTAGKEIVSLNKALAQQAQLIMTKDSEIARLRSGGQQLREDNARLNRENGRLRREVLEGRKASTSKPSPPPDPNRPSAEGKIKELRSELQRCEESRRLLEERLADTEAALSEEKYAVRQMIANAENAQLVVIDAQEILDELEKRGIRGPWDSKRNGKASRRREALLKEWSSKEAKRKVEELTQTLQEALSRAEDAEWELKPLRRLCEAKGVQAEKLQSLLHGADNEVEFLKTQLEFASEKNMTTSNEIDRARAQAAAARDRAEITARAAEEEKQARIEEAEKRRQAEARIKELLRQVEVLKGGIQVASEDAEREKSLGLKRARRLIKDLQRQAIRDAKHIQKTEEKLKATRNIADALQAQIDEYSVSRELSTIDLDTPKDSPSKAVDADFQDEKSNSKTGKKSGWLSRFRNKKKKKKSTSTFKDENEDR